MASIWMRDLRSWAEAIHEEEDYHQATILDVPEVRCDETRCELWIDLQYVFPSGYSYVLERLHQVVRLEDGEWRHDILAD